MSTINDLLKAAENKDAGAFEETFAEIMSGKMEQAVTSKYEDMFGEGYKKKMKEEDDEDESDEDDEDEDDEDEDDEDEDED